MYANLPVSVHNQKEVKTETLLCLCVFRVMHDEVSDTENIRKNLAIERMIVEGCDILLDTSQTFVRQGELCSPSRPSCEPPLNFRASSDQGWYVKGLSNVYVSLKISS